MKNLTINKAASIFRVINGYKPVKEDEIVTVGDLVGINHSEIFEHFLKINKFQTYEIVIR